jgi:Flp pilus assembly protein TadG
LPRDAWWVNFILKIATPSDNINTLAESTVQTRKPLRSPRSPFRGLARFLGADRRGTIAIVAALSLLALMGVGAMALDLAQLYLTKSTDQRIADQSALAAAFAYGQSGNTAATAQTAASSLAVANGASGSTVTTTIVTSPSGDGNKAAMVVVATPVSLSPFGRFITTSQQNPSGLLNVNVAATAYAEIESTVAACMTALGSSGVSTSGGGSLTATGCAVASAGSVTVAGSADITAQAVYAVGSISPSGTSCNGGACVTTSPIAGQLYPGSSAPTDPYAGADVFGRLPTVAAMTAASFPSVGSAPSGDSAQKCTTSTTLTLAAASYGTVSSSSSCGTISFTGGVGTVTNIGGSGLSLSGSSVVVSFGAGTYNIDGISTGGNTAITFNLASGVTLNVSSGIVVSGSSALTVNGPGTYDVQGGITNNSAGAMVFNNSGSATVTSTFVVKGGIDIANGPGTFPNGSYTITTGDTATGAGIDVGGGSTATFGNGSFDIAGGINVGSGAKLTIGGALSSNSVFQIPSVASNGDAIDTGGGSSLTLGSFTNFDINGPVTLAGNVSLGGGTYTINGALDASASGGDSITGTGVSIIASGAISFGAGYSTVSLSAPATISGATQGSASTVVLASDSTAASTVDAGASNTSVVGAVYLPNGALTLDGAGDLSGGAGGCLEVVASGITLSGGGTASTDCASLSGAAGSASVALVQ